MTEDEMVGWPHRLYGHEFEYTPGVGDGQGDLEFCSSWGCKELDTTERLNRTEGLGEEKEKLEGKSKGIRKKEKQGRTD